MRYRLQYDKYRDKWRVQEYADQYCDLPSFKEWKTLSEFTEEHEARAYFKSLIKAHIIEHYETVEEA